ncbi:MAG: ATP-binding protein [Pseudomonadota bacterium]|nr:ATP-binding protein [Pseudomonadota bacterium]
MEIKVIPRRSSAIILLAALAMTATGLALLSQVTSNSADFGSLYQTILVVNTLGAVMLMLLIGANLVSLYRDFITNKPGSKLKARMVGAITGLVIAPMIVVYLYSVEFLSRGIDTWFDIQVEQGLGDALELSRAALDLRMRDNMEETRKINDLLYSVPDNDMYQYLAQLRVDSSATELSAFAGGTRIIATSSVSDSAVLPKLPSDEMLYRLRSDSYYLGLEFDSNGNYLVRTGTLLPGRSGREIRVLQAVYPLSQRLAPLATSVQQTVARYSELSFLREPVKSSYILTLSLVVLFSLLLAVSGGFAFSRRMTAPLQNLVAGTQAVAKGDFDTRLPAGRPDEIGFLVDSFNDMIERLGTERSAARQSEQQVENERANLAVILARLSTGVISLESNLTIRTANESASQLLNQEFREQEGQSILRLAENNEVLKQFVEICQEHLEAGETEWRKQIKLIVDGNVRNLVCACTDLPSSFRSRSGLVIVFDDVTELLQAQRDAAWGEVARRLAHEIKNPLTPIQLSAERIRHKYLDTIEDENAQLLDRATSTIVQQVEAMRDMVNAFSQYARAPQINLTKMDINQLIQQVADLYPANSNQPKLILDLDESVPHINIDAVRVRQVLHNLIRNALEALEKVNNAEVRLSTKIFREDDISRLEIAVKDNGPGFIETDQGKVFEPYVTTKSKGTGLGLAIVKKLIEEHGGEVSFDSKHGEGAQVTILLPINSNFINDNEVKRTA